MKIELRKFKMSDLDRIFSIFANDNLLKSLSGSLTIKDITRSKEKKWIEKNIKNYKMKQPESLSFAIIVDGEIVGSIGFHHADWENRKTEFGYWLGEEYWGRGYATESVREFIKLIFKRYKLVRLEALPYSYNIASQRVLEKSGLKFEGERIKATKRFGKYVNDKLYAIVK